MPAERTRATLAATAAATLWGTVGATQELGAHDAAPVVVAAVRSAGGGVALLALVVATGGGAEVLAVVRRAPWRVAAATVAITAFQVGLLTSVREAGVAIGTLVSIGTAPVWAGAFATLGGRAPGRRWVVGTVATLAGVSLLVLPGGGLGDRIVLGTFAGVVAGAAYGTYATVTARLVRSGSAGVPAMAAIFVGAGLLLSPVMVAGELTWVATPRGLAAVLWLVLGGTVAGYVLFARALATLDAPTVTTLTLAEPLAATALALVVIGERLTVVRGAGAVLLLLGLAAAGGRPRLAVTGPREGGPPPRNP